MRSLHIGAARSHLSVRTCHQAHKVIIAIMVTTIWTFNTVNVFPTVTAVR
jgi:hypothetical protein